MTKPMRNQHRFLLFYLVFLLTYYLGHVIIMVLKDKNKERGNHHVEFTKQTQR